MKACVELINIVGCKSRVDLACKSLLVNHWYHFLGKSISEQSNTKTKSVLQEQRVPDVFEK